MKKILNYIGQLRIYSLVDLVILLIVVKATSFESIGIFCLHIGFLAYLESRHSHKQRAKTPKWLWIFFGIPGIFFYNHWEAVLFLVCSYFYTKKNSMIWSVFSPFFRGLQYFFLLAGVVGYCHQLPWIAFLVLLVRNTMGDWRDIRKDSKEEMKTIPMIFGLRKNLKYGHLVAMILSTTIWWTYSNLPFYILLLCLLIETTTYNLTPR
jgi:hypothetical protein